MTELIPNERDFAPVPGFEPDFGDPAASEDGMWSLPIDRFIAARQEGREALIGTADDALLPSCGLALLAGQPGAGKTTLAIDLAFHLASGVDWLGQHVSRPLRVLLIENEGPREPFRRKLAAKRETWPHTLDSDALHVYVHRWGALTLANAEDRADLQALVGTEPIDVVIADPLGSLGVEGVGRPAETRAFLSLLLDCGLFRDVAFVLLHHFRHGSSRGDAAANEIDELSGAWGGHADAIIVIKGAEGDRTRLSFPKLRWAQPRRPLILGKAHETAGFDVLAEEGVTAERDLEAELLAHLANDGGWRTLTEIATKKKGGIGRNRDDVREMLEHLVEAGEVEYAEGPTDRASDAKCWRTGGGCPGR